MPVVKNIVDFSSDGEYLAYASPDGCLKIWDISSNILTQEYTPSSHLSATCSAISWCPSTNVTHPSKKRKKEKVDEDFSAVKDLQLIAMGTLTGQILLYSYKKADLYSCLTNGHTGKVNDVCWCTSTGSIFSCSNDKNIIMWDVFTGKVKIKWKGDNFAVHSICIIGHNRLLSASSSIKLWNIKQKAVIMTFTGHASEVFRLIPLKNDEETQNSYFISAAVGDRVINAWQLNDDKRAVASFVVSDEPETISVFSEANKSMLCVVCRDGSLHLFEHVLNGYMKKPIRSKLCLQIASKRSDSQRKPEKVPILCASLSLGLISSLIAYGSFLKPTFERIDFTSEEYSKVSNDMFLIRDTYISAAGSQEESVTRIKHTDKTEKVKLLAPGHLTPGKDATNVLRKRRKKELLKQELPMEERLRALDLSRIPPNLEEQDSILKADSMVHLLLQGLQSKDNNMINTVLQSHDERIIQNTIKRLPLQSIILLLKELHIRLNRKEQRNHPYIKWMKCLLSVHLPYLMSCKDISEYLGPINQIIQARIENFTKMCQLHGCLKILLSETTTTTEKSEKNETDKPLAVYQSDSSEEESDAEENNSTDMESSDDELTSDDSLGESSSSSESGEEEMVL